MSVVIRFIHNSNLKLTPAVLDVVSGKQYKCTTDTTSELFSNLSRSSFYYDGGDEDFTINPPHSTLDEDYLDLEKELEVIDREKIAAFVSSDLVGGNFDLPSNYQETLGDQYEHIANLLRRLVNCSILYLSGREEESADFLYKMIFIRMMSHRILTNGTASMRMKKLVLNNTGQWDYTDFIRRPALEHLYIKNFEGDTPLELPDNIKTLEFDGTHFKNTSVLRGLHVDKIIFNTRAESPRVGNLIAHCNHLVISQHINTIKYERCIDLRDAKTNNKCTSLTYEVFGMLNDTKCTLNFSFKVEGTDNI